MSQPGLKVSDDIAVVSAQRLLEIQDLWLDVTQNVNMAIWRGEWENGSLLFHQFERLGVNGIVSGIGFSGSDPVFK
jgi:hypothetical protein